MCFAVYIIKWAIFVFVSAPTAYVLQPFTSGVSYPSFRDATMRQSMKVSSVESNTPEDTPHSDNCFMCCRRFLRETLKMSNAEDLNRLTACSLVLLGHIFYVLGNHRVRLNTWQTGLVITKKEASFIFN